MSTFTAESLSTTIDRLKRMRHATALTARKPPEEGGSLLPLLEASACCCALDNAIRVLEEKLKAAAS